MKKTVSQLVIISFLGGSLFSCIPKERKEVQHLREALTFYSSFDKGTDADISLGDKRIYTVAIDSRKDFGTAKEGIQAKEIQHSPDKGRNGGALEFTSTSGKVLFYRAKDNIGYHEALWNGTLSMWMLIDPEKDLDLTYCDPVQITDESYNDAAIWVDFTKENPRDFRLGVIGDRALRKINDSTYNEEDYFDQRLIKARKKLPFSRENWTHIAITFEGLNSSNGKAALYLNGVKQGEKKDISDTFTWMLENANIFLGFSYVGLLDELAIFNRAMTQEEITTLYQMDKGF